MDFGDIITVLVYIMIPLLISSRRKADRKRKTGSSEAGRSPGRASGRGLMDRLEQMVNEMEKKMADTNAERPSSRRRLPTESVPNADPVMDIHHDSTVDWQQVYMPSQSAVQQVDIQELYTGTADQKPETDNVLTDKAVDKAIDKVPGEIGGIDESEEKEPLFGSEDIVKGIILSEILKPPKALQRSRRHPI
jgi:hypothetical protein